MGEPCQATPTTLSGDIVEEARQVAVAAANRLMSDSDMQFMIDLGTSVLVITAAEELSEADLSVSLDIEQVSGLLCACDWVSTLSDKEIPEEKILHEMAQRVWYQLCDSPMQEESDGEAGE